MLPYFITFAISISFCASGEYALKNKMKMTGKILLLISVFTVALLAGLRDYSIGTDVMVYGNNEFFAARSTRSLEKLIQNRIINIEPLYVVLNYIVSRFTNNPHWVYFFVGMIIYGFVMGGLYKYKNNISITMGWICFLLLFYAETLNAMRQHIAMAIVFWGFHFALEKKYAKYILTVIVASLFHRTAIISVSIFGIYCVLKISDTLIIKLGMILGVVGVAFLYNEILQFFINVGLFSIKYTNYLAESFEFDIKPIIVRVPILVLIFLFSSKFKNLNPLNKEKKVEGSLYIFLLIVELLLVELRSFMPIIYRVSIYFGYYKLFAYSRVYKVMSKDKKIYVGTLLVVYLIIMWVYQVVIKESNEIYPYMFGFWN